MIRTRIMLQAVFAVLFVLSVVLTYYYIRLGIVGMLASGYAFSEARSSITGKIPGFWKKRMYWEKFAIIFGSIHFVVFIITLMPYKDLPRGEGMLGLILIELPLFSIGFLRYFDKFTYYSLIVWGTLSYAFVGAILGIIIDGIIYYYKIFAKKGETHV